MPRRAAVRGAIHAKIGAYVNGLFVCMPAEADTIAEAVEEIALPGAQIVTNPDDAIATLSRAR